MKLEVTWSEGGRIALELRDDRGNRIVTNDGETPAIAAARLVRSVNRIVEQAEELILELNLLTPEQIDAAAETPKTDDAATQIEHHRRQGVT